MDPQVAFYIAQGISVVTGVLAILLMQFKNMKTILLFQIIVNLLASSNYLLLGGDTGAIVSALAIIQSVVMFLYSQRQRKPHLAVIVGFICAYVACSTYNIVMTRDLMELLPAFAAVCFSVSLVQEKPSVFRIWGALNPSFWLAYDLYTRSYVMFCVHLGILISSVVAMVRLDGLFRIKGNGAGSKDE
ncbi:MAG: YgjV family protein [Clostridia bacterium]|nr:YgjV family protein [Clostridia bacterium]